MTHEPGHDHHHGGGCGHHHHHGSPGKNIGIALALNASFAVVELFGGLWTGSVAILADAVHDLGDSLALALALGLEKAAGRKSNSRYSYGYRRLSLLSAVLTGAFLVVASILVLSQAVPRLLNPVYPKVEGMALLALLGIAVNGFAAWRMQHGSTMSERVLSWHLLEDVLGWVAVLIVSIVMRFVDLPILDPLLSIVFTLVILFGVMKTLRRTIHLFLQGTPTGLDLESLKARLRKIPGVCDFHDLHLWSLDGESHVLTLHVVVPPKTDIATASAIRANVRTAVGGHGKIHVTVEIEESGSECPDVNCVGD